MCGINGLIYKNRQPAISEMLGTMNGKIIHRGPDDDGVYVSDDRIALGMRRLSVIDLSTGNQPMKNDAGNIVIVFNGEIYNYRILKSQLELEGVVFHTQSDTEVVLRLYEKYGTGFLSFLNGMFALAIHDVVKETVLLARDRFGEKPLYYYSDEQKFVWASELKSIVTVFPALKKIDMKSINLFFALTYIPAPATIYNGVHKLKAGHYLSVNTNDMVFEIHAYWDLKNDQPAPSQTSYTDAKKELRELLFESVEQRMIADVPLGVFLSGGVDSTVIAAIMAKISSKKIKAFTVGYDNPDYDESSRATIVAGHIGAEHKVFKLSHNDMLATMDSVILNYDEPFADSSALPTYFISAKAVKEVTVALTGDGGDEVFGGYNKYRSLQYREKIDKWVPGIIKRKLTNAALLEKVFGKGHTKSASAKLKRFLSSLEGDVENSHLNIIALGFRQQELNALLLSDEKDYKDLLRDQLREFDYSGLEGLKLLRYLDKEISLEGDMLVKVDRASMLCSLECRAPLLDHRLMERTWEWPDHFLIEGRNQKRILKDTFADLLPSGFFDAPKSGFEVPVGQWLRNELKDDVTMLLSAEVLSRHGLFNIDYVQKLLKDHLSTKYDHTWKLWTLYCFQKWYQHNFD